MAASTGRVGYAATLTGGATVGQLTRISFPTASVSDIDISNMDSDSAAMEFLPGLIDTGTVDAEVIYETTAYAAMHAEFVSRASVVWTLAIGDGFDLTFTAYINALSGDDNVNEGITATMSLKVTGLAVYAAV